MSQTPCDRHGQPATTLTKPQLSAANAAWESLLQSYASMMRKFLADEVWEDLTAREYDVLYTLAKAGREIRQSELLEGVLLSQPAISRLVDRLVVRGLVLRRVADEDRRSILLCLSDEGRALQRKVGKCHGRLVAERMWAGLTAAEMQQLTELTSKIREANS
ncbi:hypothetical protein GCM10010401_19360 [Rarobacter faecitabidus]|uniref:MarR family transcriptional regulator n=1 Tax=Rarobacter faecitabidus TaxID=13243 RepID=A0A542ZUU9_RARFA|nr:MarR family transcriptional regulator [Rarobacter faecitabidus]TQL64143.1 MarR family transcriptional regulator [Rarobacter faecitabidus]